MAGPGEDFLGGSTIHQIVVWGVLVELLNSISKPLINTLQQAVAEQVQTEVLSPADAADAVVRGALPMGDGERISRLNGLSVDDFAHLVALAGEPPALQQVLEMWRRGIIEWGDVGPGKATVANAIATSRVYTYWSDAIKAAQFVPLPLAEAVDAVVEGQIAYADGEKIAYENGVSATDFRIAVNTRGNPPSPSELIDMWRRGFIPMQGVGPDKTTVQQGIFEGATKDKWEPIYEKFAVALPPPRTVTAVYKAGGYTADQALALFKAQGLSDADAQAYLTGASGEKLAGTVQLAQSLVETLYFDRSIDQATATTMLNNIGYSNTDAAFILGIQDFKREQTAVTSAVSRIGSLFIGHKIDASTARAALGQLNVPGTQADQLVQTWTIEAGANIKLLTEAQIVDAWAAGIIDQGTAQSELEGIGYQPFDAWVLLSIKNKGPLGQAPPAGPAPLYVAPPPPPGA